MQNQYHHEAMFGERTPRGIKCMICPNECMITEGSSGICGTRQNHGGVLYSVVYGNPCSVHTDPVEKKPLLHFYPGSLAFSVAATGCNLSCLNCQNWTISQDGAVNRSSIDLMPEQIVEQAVINNCKSIAYTYTEPFTFYEYMLDTARIAHEKGIKNILVSAGYVNEGPVSMLASYIDAANIDLKSFSDDIYKRLNRGRLEPVLRTLTILKDAGVWLEITNLLIPGWNDDLTMVQKMCKWLKDNGFEDVPIHFSRFFPTYKLQEVTPTPLSLLHEARKVATGEGLHYVYIGNAFGEGENTNCHSCGKLLIRRKGYHITHNQVHSGTCTHCGQPVPGRWSNT